MSSMRTTRKKHASLAGGAAMQSAAHDLERAKDQSIGAISEDQPQSCRLHIESARAVEQTGHCARR